MGNAQCRGVGNAQYVSSYEDCIKIDSYLEENSGHRVECLLWPGLKPVYDSAVDQAREVAAACAEGLTHRRHCQHHMQVVAALQHKLRPAGILAVVCALLHSLQQTSRSKMTGPHCQACSHPSCTVVYCNEHAETCVLRKWSRSGLVHTSLAISDCRVHTSRI